jgi:hypothetical protein
MKTITKEIAKGETTEVMETVLFTDVILKEVKSQHILKYSDCIPFIAYDNKIAVFVAPNKIEGTAENIEKVQDKIIKSIMYN